MSRLILTTIDKMSRYSIGGQTLFNGDLIELRIGDQWSRGRFFWNGDVNLRPLFQTTGYGKSIAESDDVRRDTYVPSPVPEQIKPRSATLTDSERRAND
ncbi:MAG: hypothetical protein EXS05_17200 [Planctomycetaceae bacterium]|nr:hypothetical protein [Planctomycetaceae bacterium]